MKALVLAMVALMGCGEVVTTRTQGASCMVGSECLSGNCVDGTCCDNACADTCEACTSAKTGGADGQCLPVEANTDPDAECPSSCTAEGAVTSTCSGSTAACESTTTACGQFACDSATTTCRSTCSDNTACAASGYCNLLKTCAKRLRVAIQAHVDSCTRTQALPLVEAALIARGHTATVVDGTMVDEAAELANYDVVLTGGRGSCQTDDRAAFDAVLGPWVMGGGGLVASGWLLYIPGPPNFQALMPNSGNAFLSGTQTVTIVGPHPIVDGLSTFTETASYLPHGGMPKVGSTQLLAVGGQNVAQAWAIGSGRVVFNGLLHLDSYTAYATQPLVDGTIPQSLEILIRSVEWAGRSL